ncbi:hypothetical protein AAC387_Pa03g2258 [Persea americana]
MDPDYSNLELSVLERIGLGTNAGSTFSSFLCSDLRIPMPERIGLDSGRCIHIRIVISSRPQSPHVRVDRIGFRISISTSDYALFSLSP